MGVDHLAVTAFRPAVYRWDAVGPLAGLLCLLGLLVSCSGSSSGNPAAPSPPPAPRLLTSGEFTLSAPAAVGVFFTVVTGTDPAAGTWEATVDWTSATNTLWMYVSNGACTVAQFSNECPNGAACACQFTVRSEVATPKPRVLTIPNAPGGTRSLIVANLGPGEESGNYRITLTTAQTASSEAGESSRGRTETGSGMSNAKEFLSPQLQGR